MDYLKKCNKGLEFESSHASDGISINELTYKVEDPKKPIQLPLSTKRQFLGEITIPGGLLYEGWSVQLSNSCYIVPFSQRSNGVNM